jgi:hypothetical protein
MSEGTLLLSTAYFPPIHYISLIRDAGKILIEKEENYTKQTYRNRCCIYSPNGPMTLTVPVLEGSFHKRPLRDIRIDYSKRWQQIHTRAIISSYKSAPYFDFFFPVIEEVITRNHTFLLDLNMHSIDTGLKAIGLEVTCRYTEVYSKPCGEKSDFRERITTKKRPGLYFPQLKEYTQVFGERYGFIPGLSIIDLILNAGPDAKKYL